MPSYLFAATLAYDTLIVGGGLRPRAMCLSGPRKGIGAGCGPEAVSTISCWNREVYFRANAGTGV
jgi:hypothetical protein